MQDASAGGLRLPAPQLPKKGPDDEKVGTSLRLPKWLRRGLDDLAKERGIDLSDVAVEFLRWALEEWSRANPKGQGSKPSRPDSKK
jgi:hypothetical protein